MILAVPARGHMPFPGHRTCAEAPIPPDGCSEVPAQMMWEPIAGTLGLEQPDESDPDFRTAMILIAPMFAHGCEPEQLSRWTSYPINDCAHVARTMTENGIWKDGHLDPERYEQGGDKPGFQMGDLSLVLDVMLCMGEVRCTYGGDRWHSAEKAPRLNRDRRRIDQFAEHLADGLSVKEAAKLVGATPHYGNAMLQRMRRNLGAQAV